MRSSLLASLALASGALLFSLGAKAVPIHVGLKDASGHHSWTSPPFGDPSYLTLTAWEYDNGWTEADLIWQYANLPGTPGYPDTAGGLGVSCNQQPTGNACGDNQIGSVPWQIIDVDITQLIDWNSLTISLYSLDPQHAGLLLGAKCTVGGSCQPVALSGCTNTGTGAQSCSLSLSYLTLLGITDIWITPSATNPDGINQGNILLGADFIVDGVPASVPEPKPLGIFGLGLLLIGAFVGLRRRWAS